MTPSAEVISLPRGAFAIVPIEYRCELSKRDGQIIQIGAIAEVAFPQVRGLGLIARTALNEHELRLVGPLAARVMARPFDLLLTEFKEAWENSKSGTAIDYLSRRTHGSLVFGTPENRQIPAIVKIETARMKDMSQAAVVIASIGKLLSEVLEDKMLEMIWNTLPPSLSNFQQVEPERERVAA